MVFQMLPSFSFHVHLGKSEQWSFAWSHMTSVSGVWHITSTTENLQSPCCNQSHTRFYCFYGNTGGASENDPSLVVRDQAYITRFFSHSPRSVIPSRLQKRSCCCTQVSACFHQTTSDTQDKASLAMCPIPLSICVTSFNGECCTVQWVRCRKRNY